MAQTNPPIDIETALQIYLTGYQSGLATGARVAARPTITHEQGIAFARQVMNGIEADPAVLETMREHIIAKLEGREHAPTVLTLQSWRDPNSDGAS